MTKFHKVLLAGLGLGMAFSSFAVPKATINSALEPSSDGTEYFVLSSGSSAAIEHPSCKAKSAVLLIHGWVGKKDELGNLYKDLSEQLKGNCIASLRFDVQGEAERVKSNFRLTSTFKSRMEDTESALEYLKEQYPEQPLVVVGFSLGGATAMELVSRHPNTFEGIVLWSTALNPNEIVTLPNYYAAVREAIDEGESVLNETWADLTLTRQHVIGMLGYNPIRNLNQFKGHLLAIRGTEDYLPRHENEILRASMAVTEDVYYLDGADHIFHVLNPKKSQKAEVLNLTTDWIVGLSK
ncbi:alpha/beta hydrolase [Paraglaciecola sp. 2405UD69-4]|uniref:alpha/beta hydrolase n=1 Tax=Paraglaciecola sp. 2405UD69-4 TaxID=3391836 RepID=UPI0039C8C760